MTGSDRKRAIAYRRVSTDEQATSGLGLEAQNEAIRLAVQARGWRLVDDFTDAGQSGAVTPDNRPAMSQALEALKLGRADVLVAAKVDRLSRSVLDFAGLIARSQREGWALVVLDLDVDTTTPAGELLAHIVASTAQYERRLISQRTRDALSAKRAQGVRLGRPQAVPTTVVERVVSARAQGLPYAAIAAALTRDGIPTARGGFTWHPSSVRDVSHSQTGVEATKRLGLTSPAIVRRGRRT